MLTESEIAIIISVISLSVAILSVLVKRVGITLQKRSGKIQHLIPDLDMATEKLRKMSESSLRVKGSANDALNRSIRQEYKRRGMPVQEANPETAFENSFKASVTELDKECQDYCRLFLSLREKGFFNRILKIENSLAWELLNTSFKTESFLNLKLMNRMSKEDSALLADQWTLVTIIDIAGQILDCSKLSLQKLYRFLDLQRT